MTLFLEEKRGEEATVLKRELAKLKTRRVQLLERGDTRSLKAVEKRIESIRYRLGRAKEREDIIKTELRDAEYIRMNHTYDEYLQLRERKMNVHHRWGVCDSTLKTWVKEEEEKLKTRIEEQEALIGRQVQAITELEKQNGELQDMLHGYEQQLNAADDAQNATYDELEMLRAELADVKHQLKEMTAKEFRVRIAFDQQVAENAEMMRELDEYAEMLGNAEQQHDVLKQVAKPLLHQFVNEL